MAAQEGRTPCHLHSCHGTAGYDHSHLFAPVRHPPLSRDAWHLEKSPPPYAVLARGDASPLPWAEDRGRTYPLDPSACHSLALASSAQSRLLGCPSAGHVVCRGSPADLATA